jgi:hypothetical protein
MLALREPNKVDLVALTCPSTTFVHDLACRLRCRKCSTSTDRHTAAAYAARASHADGGLKVCWCGPPLIPTVLWRSRRRS